jgi:osmotically-inducible protein OsmY
VVHVTTHWFADGTGNTLSDAALEGQIVGVLLFAKDVPSTQIAVDVWGGNVVLTGIMADQDKIDRAIAATGGVSGVHSVTSYLKE